jgi:hypothetical protein
MTKYIWWIVGGVVVAVGVWWYWPTIKGWFSQSGSAGVE